MMVVRYWHVFSSARSSQARIPLRLLAALALALVLAGCTRPAREQALYYCPMHPQVTSGKAGDCQICGMHLVIKAAEAGGEKARHAEKVRLVCPMHPGITSDKPADCSICGMHLEKDLSGQGPSRGDTPAGMAPVVLTPESKARLGLTLGSVEKKRMARTVRASGRIVADETRIYRMIARVEGFVDQLFVQYIGLRVRKGQPLLGLYSLNLLSVQQQFLNASPSEGRRFVAPPSKPASPSAEEPEKGEDTQRQRLKYWDFSDEQIDRIQKAGKAENSLILVAPASGFVTEKNALLGQKVFPGDTLLVITDLSAVWAEAEVSEMDAPLVKIGMPMEIRPASMPGRTFKGRVKFFQPILDPLAHTMKVFVELPNPDLALKPGMLGSAELTSDDVECLAIPESSVMRTGEVSYTFVADGERLIPRSIVLGARGDGYFEVVSGLKEGDRVATSAMFLLDSESSLKAALQAAGGNK